MKQECALCRFWQPHTNDNGYCRRFPPNGLRAVDRAILDALIQIHWVISQGGKVYTDEETLASMPYDNAPEAAYQAATRPDDWCGEYQQAGET